MGDDEENWVKALLRNRKVTQIWNYGKFTEYMTKFQGRNTEVSSFRVIILLARKLDLAMTRKAG